MEDVIEDIAEPINTSAPTEEQTSPEPAAEDEFEFVSEGEETTTVDTSSETTAESDPAETEIGHSDDANAGNEETSSGDDTIAPPPPPEPEPDPEPVEQPNTIVSYSPFGFVTGTEGMDVILAYGFRTIANGLGGDDTMIAFNGSAYFRGGDGNDVLIGGSLADTLFGDDGNDQLLIGGGDFAVGGDGADQFIFSTTDKGTVIVSDFDASEGDILVFSKTADVTCQVIENVNNTEIVFSDGLNVLLYGVTYDEVMANPDVFSL